MYLRVLRDLADPLNFLFNGTKMFENLASLCQLLKKKMHPVYDRVP